MTLAERRNYIKKNPLAYGGELRNTRQGRSKARPISNRQSMHLVLRSTRAKGLQSFKRPRNAHQVKKILERFAEKYQVKLHSFAIQGNHLHIHLQIRDYNSYKPFIRAVTAAIAMAIAGTSRWKKAKEKFWDHRPFTHIAPSRASAQRVEEYVEINNLEGLGFSRIIARLIVEKERKGVG